jgi:pimeloyl-ACP methyl ester carboxylesterase
MSHGAPMTLKTVTGGPLEIAYAEHGLASGWPCILLHGFPYDIHACEEAASLLAGEGARVILP